MGGYFDNSATLLSVNGINLATECLQTYDIMFKNELKDILEVHIFEEWSVHVGTDPIKE